jgi:hypothetical protein
MASSAEIVLLANRAPDPPNARVLARPVSKEAIASALDRVARSLRNETRGGVPSPSR